MDFAVCNANLREKSAAVQHFGNLLMEMKNGIPTVWRPMASHHNMGGRRKQKGERTTGPLPSLTVCHRLTVFPAGRQ